MKSTKIFMGILAALVLVAGGVYGIQNINAGENCASHTATKATADKGEAKVETVEAASATTTTSATTATSAGCCASKATAANATTAGATCTYNAKMASAQCATTEAKAGVMTAEATFAKLAHCGIDCRTADAQVLSAKLASGHCGSYTQEEWAAMIKSAQALDAKQADVIFANATSDKPCAGDGCSIKKVAVEMAAAQNEEKKESTN